MAIMAIYALVMIAMITMILMMIIQHQGISSLEEVSIVTLIQTIIFGPGYICTI